MRLDNDLAIWDSPVTALFYWVTMFVFTYGLSLVITKVLILCRAGVLVGQQWSQPVVVPVKSEISSAPSQIPTAA